MADEKEGIKVYYNSACPVCNAGIKAQKGKMAQCQVQWKNVHAEESAVEEVNAELEFVRKRLHAKDEEGNIAVGFEAFLLIWENSPKETWKAKVFSLPVIRQLANLGYNAFAWCLYRFNRFMKRW